MLQVLFTCTVAATGRNDFHTQRGVPAYDIGQLLERDIFILAGVEKVQQHMRKRQKLVSIRLLENLFGFFLHVVSLIFLLILPGNYIPGFTQLCAVKNVKKNDTFYCI